MDIRGKYQGSAQRNDRFVILCVRLALRNAWCIIFLVRAKEHFQKENKLENILVYSLGSVLSFLNCVYFITLLWFEFSFKIHVLKLRGRVWKMTKSEGLCLREQN